MLFCVTASHRTTDFDVLDRISRVGATEVAGVLAGHGFVRGAVVLSTCNRFEAYLDIDEPVTAAAELATEAVFQVLAERAGDDAESLRSSATVLCTQRVVHHLFSVSAGLDSMVMGEEEIVGQVQRALREAREAGTSSSALEALFQRAAHTSREARAHGDLAAAGRSVARVALEMADSRIPDWSAVRVLMVGTGSYAATTLTALRSRGADDVRVFSATGRAAKFAARYGVHAEDDLRDAIADADVVITCTARYTVATTDIPDASPRLVIDLGLPRNVDPDVRRMPGIELLDLEIIGRHVSLPDFAPGVHEVVRSAAESFEADRAAAPAVVALRRHIDAVLQDEINRSRRRGGEDQRTEAALRHLAGILLHEPSLRARELAAEGRIDEFERALALVYGLEVEAAADAASAPRLVG